MTKTIGYYVAFVALGLINASLGPTLPGLAERTHTQIGEIGFLFTARSFGYLIGSLIGGRLYDRVPGHRVMGLMLIAVTIMMGIAPLVPLLWLLTLALLALGVAEGAVDVGGNTLLVWVHREKVGPFMNGLHFFFGVGAFLSPIIVAQAMLRGGGILAAYWALGLLVLPIGLWLLRLPSPAVQTTNVDDPSNGRVNHLLVVLIGLFFFLYAGAEIGFGGWIFTYALKTNLADEAMAAYLNAGFWGAFTLGRLLAIPIATRLRPRAILSIDLIGGLVSVGLILLGANSLLLTWLGTLGFGLALASTFPTTLSFAERRMTITGQVTSWFFVGASLGAMFWPWLMGQLFEAIAPIAMMITIAGVLMAAFAVFLVLMSFSKATKPIAGA
jgi:fucose permease